MQGSRICCALLIGLLAAPGCRLSANNSVDDGLYVNEATGIQLAVSGYLFIERMGSREVHGQLGYWRLISDSDFPFASGATDEIIFKGIILDPAEAQTNREQRAEWIWGELNIEVAPGRTLTFARLSSPPAG
jgi:hypothetical protein